MLPNLVRFLTDAYAPHELARVLGQHYPELKSAIPPAATTRSAAEFMDEVADHLDKKGYIGHELFQYLRVDLPRRSREIDQLEREFAAAAGRPPPPTGPVVLPAGIPPRFRGEAVLREGTTFRAYDQVLRRSVVVKVPDPADPGSWDRLPEQVRNMVKPELAQVALGVYDLCADPCYAVLQFCRGRQIDEWCLDPERLSWDRVRAGLRAVACALARIHPKHAHLDLYPGVVLVEEAEGKPYVRLKDFAPYEQGTLDQEPVPLTDERRAFRAPEVQYGGEVGTATDVYALGRIVDDVIRHARTTLGDPPADLVALRPLVDRCLSNEPEARPPVDELVAALEPPREPPAASPPTPREPEPWPPRRPPRGPPGRGPFRGGPPPR